MPRRASPEESNLWRKAMGGVRRTRKADAVPAPPEPAAHAARPVHAAAPVESPRGLDRRSAQRLKRGHMPIEARLDLHGMTQAEAHRALLGFLARAHERGLRALLVITGKGGEGVLRRNLPRWLDESPARGLVLGTAESQPRHGGQGATYVLLRRKRE